MISVKNISFSYPNQDEQILDKISFSIDSEIVSIMAPTGAGKTTLLNIMSGLLSINKGIVTINGNTPSQARDDKKIGFSFQESTLIEWKSVISNIILPFEIGKQEELNFDVIEQATKLISVIGLKGKENILCSELSGGMKQRVGLARALITKPDIIFFDEPFNKLDFITKTNLIIEFRHILKIGQVNCVIVTHNVEDAAMISDKVLIFSGQPLSLKNEITIPYKNRDIEILKNIDFLNTVVKIKNSILNE